MSRVRVHELAKELGVSSQDVLAGLAGLGCYAKSASSTVDEQHARALRERVPEPTSRPATWDEPAVDPQRHRLGSAPRSAETAPQFEPAAKQDDEPWVIRATAKDGRTGWYGRGSRGNLGVVPNRGNAFRYVNEGDARFWGYQAKEDGIIIDFTVEEIVKPRFKTPGVDLER
jgi:hypothetical protein